MPRHRRWRRWPSLGERLGLILILLLMSRAADLASSFLLSAAQQRGGRLGRGQGARRTWTGLCLCPVTPASGSSKTTLPPRRFIEPPSMVLAFSTTSEDAFEDRRGPCSGEAAGTGLGHGDPHPDRRPRRRMAAATTTTTRPSRLGSRPAPNNPLAPRGPWTWNVHHPTYPTTVPAFPCTLEQVTDDVVMALEGAWAGRSMNGGGTGGWGSDGRVGIEIEGARAMLRMPPRSRTRHGQGQWRDEGEALRAVALSAAIQLSRGSRSRSNDNDNYNNHTVRAARRETCRPVAVYLNTIQQSLHASGELRNLLRRSGPPIEDGDNDSDSDYCDSSDDDPTIHTLPKISLLCLTQDPVLPPSMMARDLQQPTASAQKKKRRTASSPSAPFPDIDPSRGVCIVVQPSDYNHEHRPPGPTLGAAEALQKLCARASLEGIPVVVISPRFGRSHVPSFDPPLFGDPSLGAAGAATSAGAPWILRDFVPPVYSWVAMSPQSSSSRPSPFSPTMVMKGVVERRSRGMEAKVDDRHVEDSRDSSSLSSPTLTWHMFARQPGATDLRRPHQRSAAAATTTASSFRHRYLASASYVPPTAAASPSPAPGSPPPPPPPPPYRPPAALLRRVWEEFGTVPDTAD